MRRTESELLIEQLRGLLLPADSSGSLPLIEYRVVHQILIRQVC